MCVWLHAYMYMCVYVRMCVNAPMYERMHECTYVPCTFRVLDPVQWGTWRCPESHK